VLCLAAETRQAGKVPWIGLVSGERPQVEGFRGGLRDLGYNEGKNIVLEFRNPEGKNERFPGLMAELVQLKVDVLVLTALPAILAAKQATKITLLSH